MKQQKEYRINNDFGQKEMADKFHPPVTDAYKLEDERAVGVWWINGEPK